VLRKLKWQLPRELLAARYNWCQVPVPDSGSPVEQHWSNPTEKKKNWNCTI
jgi:hypothetical protein